MPRRNGGNMRVLGIDPGSAHVGVAVLEFDGERPIWTEAQTIKPGEATWHWARGKLVGIDLVAIERPRQGFRPAGGHIIDTSWVGGRVEAFAEVAGIERMILTSYAWRRRLCGNSNAKDHMVKEGLGEFLDVPRSNAHTRDAAGVALVAGWEMFCGRLVA